MLAWSWRWHRLVPPPASARRRVAELAASGLSNKQVAAQLHLSVYTVEDHLSAVYAKLGIRSRTQLARPPRRPRLAPRPAGPLVKVPRVPGFAAAAANLR